MQSLKWPPPQSLGAAKMALMSLAGLLGATATPVKAHPHVFVTTSATVVFDKGTIAAIDHVWTFDEFYTAMAVEGLDTNKDGKFSREELAELAKTNIEGLKDFDYFTFPKLQETALKVADPVTYWLEHKDGVLNLHFRLPLAQPLLKEAKGFAFSIYDPSYFIGFELAKKDAAKLSADAPNGCRVTIGLRQKEAADSKRLGEAFFEQLGGNNYGLTIAKSIAVACDGK